MNLIACVTSNGCLGLNNDLVIRNKEDMKFFKELTTNNVVIMGRKTFESIGSKALPNRDNIVVSTSLSSVPEGVVLMRDIMEAIEISDEKKELFFIGGGEIYKEAIKFVKRAYISVFEDVIAHKCDVFFPMKELEGMKLENVEQKENFKIKTYVRVMRESEKKTNHWMNFH